MWKSVAPKTKVEFKQNLNADSKQATTKWAPQRAGLLPFWAPLCVSHGCFQPLCAQRAVFLNTTAFLFSLNRNQKPLCACVLSQMLSGSEWVIEWLRGGLNPGIQIVSQPMTEAVTAMVAAR